MAYELRRQPIRGIYLTYQFVTTLFLRFPAWLLKSALRSWRPRKSWSLKKTISVKLMRHLYVVSSKAGRIQGIPTHIAIEAGKGVKGIWVEPPTPELITGELSKWASVADVKPSRLPGYWMDRTGSDTPIGVAPEPGEKVLYCLHGGAYVDLSAHPRSPTSAIARGLVDSVASVKRVFSIEYRLSTAAPFGTAYPFPTALIDALTGYNYLVNTVGFSPSNVIIEGDSAGGNLTLALTRYLVEYRDNDSISLPHPPSALILSSPWVDLGKSHETPGSSALTFDESDFLRTEAVLLGSYSSNAFLGPHGAEAAETNRYISPASLNIDVSFAGFPRTFVHAGGAEVLLDQIRTLRDRMQKDLGSNLTYFESPDAVHDFLAFEWEPDRERALGEIDKWVNSV